MIIKSTCSGNLLLNPSYLPPLTFAFNFFNNQQVLLVGGTDTSAVTLECAMSNLLNHPDILKKARAELDTRIGHQHLIDESDLPKLPYLQSIISETLRLYPAAPLLLPHMSSDVCPIGDFSMPRDTMLLVNAWAIHRDRTLWDDPLTFKPERFQNGESEARKYGKKSMSWGWPGPNNYRLGPGVLDPMFRVGKSWRRRNWHD